MEDSKKKPIMIGVIIVCFAVAGLVFFMKGSGGSGGINSIPEGNMTWVKCSNPSCKTEYEMGERAYFTAVKERVNPMARSSSPPPLACEKCGKDSLFRAEKCANTSCGTVFIQGIAGPNDHADRCPKCGQSEIEEIRKRRLSGQE